MSLRSLISFDVLIDTDFGMLKLIDKYYHSSKVFLLGLLTDDDVIKYYLSTRDKLNPLCGFTKSSVSDDDCDSLYSQFIEKDYDRILKLSCPTLMLNTVKLASKAGEYTDIIILCKNKTEEELIMKIFEKMKCQLKCIVHDFSNRLDLEPYDSVYLKNYEDICKYSGVIEKNIYIAEYPFNFVNTEEGQVLNPYLSLEVLQYGNVLRTFNIYNIDQEKIPV